MSEIDWSGGSIPVGQFGEFNVLAQGLPTGTSLLIFKAVQLYSDGTTVNWIQVPTKAAPDPEHPAPSLVLTPPGKGSPGAAPASPVSSPAAVTTGSPAPSSADNGLAIAALDPGRIRGAGRDTGHLAGAATVLVCVGRSGKTAGAERVPT